jgi:hypothetical protein
MWRIVLPVLLLPAAAQAQGDPLKSQACGDALSLLDQARAARSAQADTLRHAATRACLGLAVPAGPRANRWAQDPVAVPAPLIVPPGPGAVAAPPRPIPPPVVIDRPATITSCDGNGCWTSDGTRLNRIGPQLLGPGSTACTVQGAQAWCP